MARNHQTSDEAHDLHKGMGSPRIAMGMNAYSVSPEATMSSVDELSPNQMQGTLVPKKNIQAGDPTNPGSKVNRPNVPYNESLGAKYRVSVPFTPTIDPAAGPTMASARVVPSISGRENPNFESGIQGATGY
jgi:hypothetical protein